MIVKGKCNLCGKKTTLIQSITICSNCIAKWRERPETRQLLKSILNTQYGKITSNIIVDEGVINLNAKDALTNDAKKFEQMITGARHLRQKTKFSDTMSDDGVVDVDDVEKKRENNDAESEL